MLVQRVLSNNSQHTETGNASTVWLRLWMAVVEAGDDAGRIPWAELVPNLILAGWLEKMGISDQRKKPESRGAGLSAVRSALLAAIRSRSTQCGSPFQWGEG